MLVHIKVWSFYSKGSVLVNTKQKVKFKKQQFSYASSPHSGYTEQTQNKHTEIASKESVQPSLSDMSLVLRGDTNYIQL